MLNRGSHYLRWEPGLDMKSPFCEIERPVFVDLL
jgi:hypothetical protein